MPTPVLSLFGREFKCLRISACLLSDGGEAEEELGGGGAAKKTCLAQGLSTCKEIKEGEEEGFPFKMYLKNGQI